MAGEAEILAGVGVLILAIVIAVFFIVITRALSSRDRVLRKMNDVELCAVDKTAKKLGLDTIDYFSKLELINSENRFRARLEKKVIKDTFGEEKKKEA